MTAIIRKCCFQAGGPCLHGTHFEPGVGEGGKMGLGKAWLSQLPQGDPTHRTSEPRSTNEALSSPRNPHCPSPVSSSPPGPLGAPFGGTAPLGHQEEKGAPLPQLLWLPASQRSGGGGGGQSGDALKGRGRRGSFSCFRVAPMSSFYPSRILNSSWGNRCWASVSEGGRMGGHKPARGEFKFPFRQLQRPF